jgi:O-acetyl-ADP-ribose deacetylase (regulator of RNase III)
VNQILLETSLLSGQTLQLVRGDITAEKTDAIVNAANAHLQHGAGVAGAILRRGGPVIQQESDAWVQAHGPVSHAEPAWTSAGNLPCRFVIHAVGPVWTGSRSAAAAKQAETNLAAAITGSLRLAQKLGLASLAFPAVSTGIFGFPKERAAALILGSIREYFIKPSDLVLVRLVLYDDSTITAFEKIWHDYFSSQPET